ncbi:MAG TPA: HlyD family efflux transporter periplasmic adaptor subunit [Blastocatellia bacterium]|jgi:HlyD family secretion protein|nr:HlyD family efflux transporter periplasmic adaptor subunit [Blastocatellia bacterium]
MSQPNNYSKKVIRAIFALMLITGSLIWWFFLRGSNTPHEIISVSGRIESDDAAVAAKTSGRIREVTVREGDQVKAGQVIATLDDEQVKARVDQAQSNVAQAEARLSRAHHEVAVLQAQLEQSRLGVNQARVDAEGRVSQAHAYIAAAEASLARAEADYKQARADAERFTALAEQGDAPAREGEQARAAAEAHKAVVQAARKQVEASRGAFLAAKANLDNPAIRAAQASAVEQQIRQAQADIQSAEAEAGHARAQLQEALANRNDLQIVAPFDGTVATRSAEPGEVVSPGTPIMTIVNLSNVYLRAFIPEGEIGRVRAGQSARVYLDSNPTRPLEAVVARIDPQASFTPENTYYRDDRVKQVVGVKLQLTNSQGFAKPGMPADGEVLVEGDKWVATNRK